jgi:hypothetical protein
MVSMQSRNGRVIDLVCPRAADVDFKEIAHALSHINCYAGHAEKPASAALHALILFDAAEERDRAYALLRDAHRAYLGDGFEPAALALAEVAGGVGAKACVTKAIAALKARHHAAICEAAGVPLPSQEARERIERADLIALQTERRDFLGCGGRSSREAIERSQPLRKRYRFRAPPDLADELYAKFKQYLPALASRAA